MDDLYLNFTWCGLTFDWRGSDSRFDNHHQSGDRWGTATVRPLGKLWEATLKFTHCAATGSGQTPEQALDAAFAQIESDVAAAREHMHNAPAPADGEVIECNLCEARATRWHMTPEADYKFYCDRHATEVRETERWGTL